MAIRKKKSFFDIINEYFSDVEELTSQFEDMFMEKPSWSQKNCTMEPLKEVTVTPKEVIVTVDLPLAKEGTIEVKPLDNRTIEISAEMKRKVRFDDFGITHHKGEFQRFYCQTRIPVPVKIDKVQFTLKKGILEVHMPRKHGERIPIE
ncbi:MAG: Hsp20/alpha crystallin family protein [Candidatus Bathyarchaeota archaeon]|jgi:HSP20 family molecular chaperone IbpA|nr:Hsp20/alpha crystallin family protein [Candidatus Bathyarchaeota archaeon]